MTKAELPQDGVSHRMDSNLVDSCLPKEGKTSFDEIRDGNEEIKKIYLKKIADWEQFDNLSSYYSFAKLNFKSPFHKPIHPIPLVLNRLQQKQIQLGSLQLSKTLNLFLKDHFYGTQSYKKIISPEFIDKIINRYGYSQAEIKAIKNIKRKGLSFVLAPDLHRNGSEFYVIELNVSSRIGGLHFHERVPVVGSERLPYWNDVRFLLQKPIFHQKLIEHISMKEKKGVIICLDRPLEEEKPKHIYRKKWARQILSRFDIPIVEVSQSYNPLFLKKSELYYKTAKGEEKVGFLFFIDHNNHLTDNPIFNNVKQSYLYGTLKSNFDLISEIGGDKSLLPFWRQLIRYYLQEETLFKFPKSNLIDLNKLKSQNDLLTCINSFGGLSYIKKVKSNGGLDVYRSDELQNSDLLRQNIIESKDEWIWQRAIPPSVRLGISIDYRSYVQCIEGESIVSPGIYSRGVPIGRTRMNFTTEKGGLINAPLILSKP